MFHCSSKAKTKKKKKVKLGESAPKFAPPPFSTFTPPFPCITHSLPLPSSATATISCVFQSFVFPQSEVYGYWGCLSCFPFLTCNCHKRSFRGKLTILIASYAWSLLCMSSLRDTVSSMMNICCFRRSLFNASSPLPPVQLPTKKEAHFWYLLPDEVKSTNLLNQYLEILSPCEKEKIFCLSGEQLTKRALLARALVRTTLARYQMSCRIDPKSLKFRKNSYGKPEVDWQYSDDWSLPPLHFNISHTSSLIACGVTMDSPIGIDVEEKQRRLKNNILAFARRYFSPNELEILTHISDPETQRQELIKLWTLKEAYVKALGKGFSALPFKTFTVRLRDQTNEGICPAPLLISEVPEITVESSDDPKNFSGNWQFVLLELIGSHYAAICMEQDMITGGNGGIPINLTLRRTIPFVEDECISGTDVVVIGGLTRLLGAT